MDLSDFSKACDDGANLQIKEPRTGEPVTKSDGTPVTIKLAGMESARWRQSRNKIGNKYIKAGRAKTVEESIDDDASLLASVTLAWDGIRDNGQDLDCNFANAKKIYMQYDWLRRQATDFINDNQNFSIASSQS